MFALAVSAPGPHLTERELSAIWSGQRFPREALRTRDGRALRTVYRGLPGLGPGPDFRGAIIAAPDGLWQGDVELHVRSSDFFAHGHDADPAYANVVLHLVFFDDGDGETPLPGGGSAPVVALGDWVEGRAAKLRAWAARGARWAEPCRTAPERLGPAAVRETLERLGAMRFRQKAAALAKRLRAGTPAEELLWQGVLEALAYGGDRETFARLGGAVPWREVRAAAVEGRVLRLLLDGYALLAPAGPRAGLRPRNRPERRLEAAAALAQRFAGVGLAGALLGPLAEPKTAGEALAGALTVPGLLGRGRALEIAGNAVLPLAAALCGPAGSGGAERVFAGLPLPARYGAVRHLHEVAGRGTRMRGQQGMLYLLRQYCTQGGCGRCPLS